jgi:Leucine rich repeat variant
VLLTGLGELAYLWVPALGAIAVTGGSALTLRGRRKGLGLGLSMLACALAAAVLFWSLWRQLFRAKDFWVGPLTAPSVLAVIAGVSILFFVWAVAVCACLAWTLGGRGAAIRARSRLFCGVLLIGLLALPMPMLAEQARLAAIQAGALSRDELQLYLDKALRARDPALMKAIVKSPPTDHAMLTAIAELEWPELEKRRAGLSDLLRGDFRSVDMIVVSRAGDDQELLSVLAKGSEKAVLYAVALSPSATPPVQLLVATNPAAPEALLCQLAVRGDEVVRRAAWAALELRGPLSRLAFSPDSTIRRAIATYSALPEGLLRHLARDPDPTVRCAVAQNPEADETVLRALSNDPDADVRGCAAKALSAREAMDGATRG